MTESSSSKSGDALSSSNTSTLHPAYTVSNIQNKIRILDGSKVTYSSWVKLFTLHATAYKVLHHIDGSTPPKTDEEDFNQWKEIDALVLQWIYATVSDDYLARILENNATALSTWNKIKEIFLSNKGSRAASLEHEFTNLTLTACSSMDEYCQKLKDLADQLADVEHPVSESRLVLQMVRGLPAEFDTVATFINQMSPKWDVARGMLQLELHRQSAKSNTSESAMLSSRPPSTPTPNTGQNVGQESNHSQQFSQGPFSQNQYDPTRGRGRGRGAQNHGGRNRGRGRNMGYQSSSNTYGYRQNGWNNNNWNPNWNPNSWQAPPPTPFPSQQWTPNHGNGSQAQMPYSGQPTMQPSQAQQALNALSPTDLGAAFSTVQLSYLDPT